MKIARRVILLIFGVVFVISSAACGSVSTSSDSSDLSGSSSQSASIQSLPTPDTTLKDDSVLGNWTDISDDTRYAKITKSDAGYQYQDPEGTYAATFKDGVLKVQVSTEETADVYFDAKSGNLVVVYQGSMTMFKK